MGTIKPVSQDGQTNRGDLLAVSGTAAICETRDFIQSQRTRTPCALSCVNVQLQSRITTRVLFSFGLGFLRCKANISLQLERGIENPNAKRMFIVSCHLIAVVAYQINERVRSKHIIFIESVTIYE